MPKSDNIYSHLKLRLLHIFTSNDIKEQNQTKQETLLAHFDRTPY